MLDKIFAPKVHRVCMTHRRGWFNNNQLCLHSRSHCMLRDGERLGRDKWNGKGRMGRGREDRKRLSHDSKNNLQLKQLSYSGKRKRMFRNFNLKWDEFTTVLRSQQMTDLYVVGNNGDVLEVECSVNLVHDVEWSRLVVMQCKHQRQWTQSLLTTRQVGDVLPRLLRWSNTSYRDTPSCWSEGQLIGSIPHCWSVQKTEEFGREQSCFDILLDPLCYILVFWPDILVLYTFLPGYCLAPGKLWLFNTLTARTHGVDTSLIARAHGVDIEIYEIDTSQVK